jgi:hypothetical protein
MFLPQLVKLLFVPGHQLPGGTLAGFFIYSGVPIDFPILLCHRFVPFR